MLLLIRAGSASGTIRQTIDVTSGSISMEATINPPLILYEGNCVDACFRNSDGDAASGNAIINTYNFTTAIILPIRECLQMISLCS